ncbi:MAG: hypothetical protein JSV66_18205 [Trueperaceae bacterium]|nr:MAG: hypothetical protein JSV66_18205 [Trueperaceae bacterium]
MKYRSAIYRLALLFGAVAGVIVLLIVACARQAPVQYPELVILEATATSKTSMVVKFNQQVTTAAEVAENYSLTGPDGTSLEVLAAYLDSDGLTVCLATEPQEQVGYALTVRNLELAQSRNKVGELSPQKKIEGSTEEPPVVASAIALSNTTVLVTFVDPLSGAPAVMGAGLDNPAYYEIAEPDLSVTAATPSADKTMVVLTTSAQEQLTYTVRVTNVLSASGMLVDPMRNTASFRGISGGDETIPPEVTSAVATSSTNVLVSFSEPLHDTAEDGRYYAIGDADGEALPVTEAQFANEFNTQVVLTTFSQRPGEDYTLTVTLVMDRYGNAIGDSNTAGFTGYALGDPTYDHDPPKVTTAGSIDNTHVVVTFSEPVEAGAEDPTHYNIHAHLLPASTDSSTGGIFGRPHSEPINPQAILNVHTATLSDDHTAVTLTTGSQSEIEYTLTVCCVQDLAGNQISPKEPLTGEFNEVDFFGTPVTGHMDSDGDGLSDAEEQHGWIVTVTLVGGETVRREVTSDPYMADTDQDGLPDATEKNISTDPRNHDTDDDELGDYRERHYIYSNPTKQDTDGDTLADGREFEFFKISPIEDDTDGDQILDADEVTLQNRDPRVSHLPRLQILIGEVSLTLHETYTYTDSEGKTGVVESSTSSTLEQGNNRTYGTSNSETMSSSIQERTKVGISASYPFNFGVTAEHEIIATESEEYNTTVSEESSIRANEAYNESFEKAVTIASTSEVKRVVDDASIRVTVDLANNGDTAFRVANLEITALQQDPVDRSRSVPVATLVPEKVLEAGGSPPVFSLGPLVPAIGPIIFQNRSVFPTTVENLLKDPRGLLFRVANYDITFEDGRNFAFASQDANDRTANFTIDYGDGRVELYRVAVGTGRIAPFTDTNGDGFIGAGDSFDNNGDGVVDDNDRIVFDANGAQVGSTMFDVLTNLLKIDYQTKVGQPHAINATVETLFRVGDVSNDVVNHKAWLVFSSRSLDEATDFDDLIVRAGESYTLAFLQDKDDDKLFAREEYLYGSCDGKTTLDPGYCTDVQDTLDTDADSVDDFDEVRDGVNIVVIGESNYLAYSDPRRIDSDYDNLSDFEERRGCLDADTNYSCDDPTGPRFGPTDPRKRDTDEDGIPDYDEVYGYAIRFIDDVDFTVLGPGEATLPDGTPNPLAGEPFVSDPLNPDSDFDGLSDGFEIQIGADPRVDDADKFADTDQDGLSDYNERAGFEVEVNGASVQMSSSKFSADTDGDGLPDLLEHLIGSNPGISSLTPTCATAERPTGTDTDCDGLLDFDEFDPDNTLTFPGDKKREFEDRCAEAERCANTFNLDDFRLESKLYGTLLTQVDSDGDTLTDDFELLEGWTVCADTTGTGTCTPRLVFSDPLTPHSDTDGLPDQLEYNGGNDSTDPTDPDTDGDGTMDGDERSGQDGTPLICADHDNDADGVKDCRNPTVADQRVTIEFTTIYFRDVAEPSPYEPPPGEFYFRLNSDIEPFAGVDWWHFYIPDWHPVVYVWAGNTVTLANYPDYYVGSNDPPGGLAYSYIKPFGTELRFGGWLIETGNNAQVAPIEHTLPSTKITADPPDSLHAYGCSYDKMGQATWYACIDADVYVDVTVD